MEAVGKRTGRTVDRWIILAGLLLAVAGLFVEWTWIALGVGVLALTLWSIGSPIRALALVLLVSLGVNWTLLLDFRIEGPVPINLLDICVTLAWVAMAGALLRGWRSRGLPLRLALPLAFYTAVVGLGTLIGVNNAHPLYAVVKDLRAQTYFLTILAGAACLVLREGQARLLAKAMILAAALAATEQLVRLLSVPFTGDYYMVRDSNIPAHSMAFALILMAMSRRYGRDLVPRRFYWPLAGGLVFAMLVTFTRTVWMQGLVGGCLTLLFVEGKSRARSAGIAAIAVFGVLAVAAPLMAYLSSGGSLEAMVSERLGRLGEGTADVSEAARLYEAGAAWEDYVKSPLLGRGLGGEVDLVDPQTGQVAPVSQLHISLMDYLWKLGPLGVLALAWLYLEALRGLWSGAGRATGGARPLAQAAFCIFASYVPLFMWSGHLEGSATLPVLGVLMGLQWADLEPEPAFAAAAEPAPALAS